MVKFHSFFGLNNIPLQSNIPIFFIQSFIHGHLGYFCVLVIVNNATVSMKVCIYLLKSMFLLCSIEIAISYGSFFGRNDAS